MAKFDSTAGARTAQAWVHGQGLQQPCISQCIYAASDMAIPGVPGATAVKQVPDLKAGRGPPTHFQVEFVVGPHLYMTTADGSPGDAESVIVGTCGFYQAVRKLKN